MATLPKLVAGDFETVALGDKRLEARACRSAEALAASPSVGLPKALTSAELEGFYRFVNNERVTFEALHGAHVQATKQRMLGVERVVVAHDSTDFRFRDDAEREGLGVMDNGGQGFYGHFSLAAGGPRDALGVVAVETWTRTAREPGERKPSQWQRYKAVDKESLRWVRAVQKVEQAIGDDRRVIHVMDREADDYNILCEMVANDWQFVIRGSVDRRLAAPHEGQRLKAVVRELEVQHRRDARLSNRHNNRPGKQRKRFPARDARQATVEISTARLSIARPDKASSELPKTLELNVVYVSESNAPAGCEPVEWVLLTNQELTSEADALRVIDDYRTRWLIEEYFKALKSGCSFEKRQHESKAALLNALGIFISIAWGLLHLRHASRDPELAARPATELFTATQLQILRLKSQGKLADQPTAREAVLALARHFGGHLPSNGDPGWQLLGGAYEDLLQAEVFFTLGLETLRCDR